ncbi:AAA family ATPase [Yersinia enterocolitica]|uniref:ParA family protein n=1 Tax=Yersinia enterocolitica TaxID=630 RepID=UPI002AC3F491|nr:AAA family ATPase [Yersinia enterocolitica]
MKGLKMSPRMTPQAFLLRKVKLKAGKVTWDTIADRLGIPLRTLKSYIAPEGSSNFRVMPEELIAKIENEFDIQVGQIFAEPDGIYKPRKKVIAISAQKGGVGKTTIAAYVAAAYAKQGYKVLAIDMDPQANLTEQFFREDEAFPLEIEPEIDAEVFVPGVSHVWNMFTPDEVFRPLRINSNLYLIGSSLDLAQIQSNDLSVVDTFYKRIQEVKNDFDIIIIDTLPSFGNLLAAAHRSSDWLVIPTELARFAKKGIRLQITTANNTISQFDHDLRLLGVVINKATFVNRTKHKLLNIQDAYLSSLDEQYGDLLMKPIIGTSPKISEAQLLAQSILDYAPASEPAMQFTDLAQEIMSRIEHQENDDEQE